MINVMNLSKGYGNKKLFSNLSFNAVAGDRIALIGANGSGKSTVMDIIASENSSDTGKVTVNKNIVSSIDAGLLILLGIKNDDSSKDVQYLVKKIINICW